MEKILLTILICALIIGVGVTALFVTKRSVPTLAKTDDTRKATPVEVRRLEPTTLVDRIKLTGSVQPWQDVTISAETPGIIEWQGVDEGDVVEAGQVLVKIDTIALQARLDQAKAQRRLAAQELERIRGLSKGGITSPQEVDRALANRDVASANLRALEIQVAKSTVRAEIAAVVDTVFSEQGEYVDTGSPLVRLVQIDRVKVVVGVSERDVSFFAPGAVAEVTLDSLPGKFFEGKLFRIATTAEQSTRTFATELEVDNGAGLIKPGMIARATLARATYPDAIMIPIFALITLDETPIAFVEEGGLARARSLEVGVFQGGEVQVTAGLSAGDRLIVVGQRDLRDGEEVAVQEALE